MSRQQQERQAHQQHRSRRSAAWEDDAWKIDSDDEDFVRASRGVGGGRAGGGSGSGNASASGSRAAVHQDAKVQADSVGGSRTSDSFSPQASLASAKNYSNTAPANVNSTSKQPARHAPPARPHPYSVNSYTQQAGGGGGSLFSPAVASKPELRRDDSVQTSSTGAGSAAGTPTAGNWTLVERTGSMSSTRGVSPNNAAETQGSGRRQGAVSGTAVIDDASTEASASTSGTVPQKPTRESRQREMADAIRDDLDSIILDPTSLLDRLSLRASDATTEVEPKALDRESQTPSNAFSDTGQRAEVDTTNAIVAVDGVVTNLPASAESIDSTSLGTAEQDVAPIRDALHARRSSIRSERRRTGFIKCLDADVVRIDELRTLAWAGVPDDLRPMVWMLLLGYLSSTRSERAARLARKRAEYQSGVRLAFQRGQESLDQAIWHQIHIDVPRTNPGIILWQREATQRALERILYVWAIRHPASGYVQGINDLATPFFEVFLSAYISTDPEQYDVALLPPAALEAVESDTFWCLSKLLDGILDNYTCGQPGIQKQVQRMGMLVSRINPALHNHFEEQSVEYMQFAFRWMNCLLMRELSVRNIVRLWDSYLADGPDAFSKFHLFVCAAFLDRWSDRLLQMDFQGVIMFLQSLPTDNWTARETELLLADAFVKKSLFGDTAHLTG